ncbi:hypothetical protein BJ322DRAFT_1020091 [Thelephora terrestris]|uniref:Uncharacterized protein n=1 Tax=Thelephora terrestris TaxID=56493 RepID=A0A9P6L7Q3_9AGAM|nr:hypothetical protein BJ322DRAFT_1020091 [Thelephora terrestris]
MAIDKLKVHLTCRVVELTGEVHDLQRRCEGEEARVEEEELRIPERAESPPAHFTGGKGVLTQWVHSVTHQVLFGYFLKDTHQFAHILPTGYMISGYFMEELTMSGSEPRGFAQKIPTGFLSGYFYKVPTMYPYPKSTWWVTAGRMVSKPTMNSQCTHWCLVVQYENRLVPIDDEVIEIHEEEFYWNTGIVRRDTPCLEFDPYAEFVPDLELNSDMELPNYDDLSNVDLNEIRQQNWANEELVRTALEAVQRIHRDPD